MKNNLNWVAMGVACFVAGLLIAVTILNGRDMKTTVKDDIKESYNTASVNQTDSPKTKAPPQTQDESKNWHIGAWRFDIPTEDVLGIEFLKSGQMLTHYKYKNTIVTEYGRYTIDYSKTPIHLDVSPIMAIDHSTGKNINLKESEEKNLCIIQFDGPDIMHIRSFGEPNKRPTTFVRGKDEFSSTLVRIKSNHGTEKYADWEETFGTKNKWHIGHWFVDGETSGRIMPRICGIDQESVTFYENGKIEWFIIYTDSLNTGAVWSGNYKINYRTNPISLDIDFTEIKTVDLETKSPKGGPTKIPPTKIEAIVDFIDAGLMQIRTFGFNLERPAAFLGPDDPFTTILEIVDD